MTDEPRPELELKSLVESLIFVSDGPVAVEDLGKALEQDEAAIETALAALEKDYIGRGMRLQRTRERIQLVSAPEAAVQVQKFLGLESSARLSMAGLETLAIIAYRQPITRPQVEAIRGVNCDGVMHNLLQRNLIEEMGRLDTVGHPIQYGTTFEFLQYFGLHKVEDLPPLPAEVNLEMETRDVAELLRGRESQTRGEPAQSSGPNINELLKG
ncbi:MAG: SMC-Scp complex subunit ScpB [Anaerolineae bacterium]